VEIRIREDTKGEIKIREDIKGEIRIREDTKGEIRIHISKNRKQHGQKRKKYKRPNNDLQNIHIKLKIE
jgi:hypothetical protein